MQCNVTPSTETVKENPQLLAWQILLSLHPEDSQIDAYIETYINGKEDLQKLQYLNYAFCNRLYKSIIQHWTCCKRKSLVQLLLTIDRYKIAPTNLPTQIIDSIMNVGWSLNQLYIIQTIIDSSDIRNLALERFSFLTSSPRMKLSALLENQSPNQSVLNRLRRNFQKEQHRINAYELIEIYQNMSEFGIIRDENELIQILKTKTLSEKETQYISTVLRDAWDHS